MRTAAVDAAKRWLDEFFRGDTSALELEVMAGEDTLFRVVRTVEQADPDWLLSRLSDARIPLAARREVHLCLTGPTRHRWRP